MASRLEQFIPTDPGAPASGWASQLQQQAFAKIGIGENSDELDDDEDDDEDDDDEDDPDADKDEATLRAELKAVRGSLSKASGSSKAKRDKIKRLERELDEAKTGKAPKAKGKREDDDEDIDTDALIERGRQEGRKAGDDRVKTAEVRTALSLAGVTDPKALSRLARMVDLGDLDLNDDGSVDGIDDAIDELKADMPQMFTKRRRRESVSGESDRSGDGGGTKTPKSASQRQADSLLGKG